MIALIPGGVGKPAARPFGSKVRRVRRAFAVTLVTAMMPFALAACGDSDDDDAGGGAASTSTGASGPGLAAAKAAVAKYREVPSAEFVPPGPPIDTESLQGKAIWFVPVSASIPQLQVAANGIKKAVTELGMKYQTCDGKFIPAEQAACITQAVNSGAGGVILDSIDPTTVGTALAQAKAKKVPIVAASNSGPSSPLLQSQTLGDVESSPLVADWIIADSGGKGEVISATVDANPSGEETAEAFYARMEKNCPDCVQHKIPLPQSTLFARLESATATAAVKNPNANYGYPQFDAMVQLFGRGAQTAGRKLKIASASGVLANMKQVKDGTGQVADVAANRNYMGWATTDRLLRMMLGEPEPETQTVPVRIFDSTNIDSVELTQDAWMNGKWWGSQSYQQEFVKLWGLS